jgi:hypothetical protein
MAVYITLIYKAAVLLNVLSNDLPDELKQQA